MAKQAINYQESLDRAQAGQSFSNYPAIFEGFLAKGIPADQIKPRENVFTFNAWKALGRCVKRGEHGVKVCTFVEGSKEDKETGETSTFRMPRSTTVFHISQTKLLNEPEDRPAPSPDGMGPQARETAESQGFKVEGFINTKARADQAPADRWLEE